MTDHAGLTMEQPTFSDVAGRAIGNFVLPIAVLCASFLLVRYMPELPDFFSVLRTYGPYFTLGVGLLISVAFKRGRALVAILSLMLAYAGFRLFLSGEATDLPARTVYVALCISSSHSTWRCCLSCGSAVR